MVESCSSLIVAHRRSSSSQALYRSFPCRHEKFTHAAVPPLPKKSFDFSGSPFSLFVFAGFSSSRFRSWTVFWKNDKTKRADYTKHQKSAGAWLSLQSDVLCNRLWKIKVGFCFLQLPPTETKAWWSSSVLPMYRYRVGWFRLMFQSGRTFLFSCYVVEMLLCYYYTNIDSACQCCKCKLY